MSDALPAALSTMPVTRKMTGSQEEAVKDAGFSRLLKQMKSQGEISPDAEENATPSPTGCGAVAVQLLFLSISEEAPEEKAAEQAEIDTSAPSLPLLPLCQLVDSRPGAPEQIEFAEAASFGDGRVSPSSTDAELAPGGQAPMIIDDPAQGKTPDRALRRAPNERDFPNDLSPDISLGDEMLRERLAASADQAPGVSGETRAPEPEALIPPQKLHVRELQTHLPAAIAGSLPLADREAQESGKAETPRLIDRSPTPAQPVKILKFDLEPAALGSISVKMRVTHMRVDIKLDAESASTCALLNETRESLNTAIAEKGLTLESYEVNLGAPPQQSMSGQGGAHRDDQNRPYSGERGFTNEDRPGQRQKQSAGHQAQGRRETSSSGSAPAGVVL